MDFVLVDIWVTLARPALTTTAPRLRPGRPNQSGSAERSRAALSRLRHTRRSLISSPRIRHDLESVEMKFTRPGNGQTSASVC